MSRIHVNSVCLLVLSLLVTGCEPKSKQAGDNDTVAGVGHARKNVLLISMDTTRPDYFGCYGHPYIKTPNIDRLAEEGTLFEQARTAAPLTAVSHSSMFTGTYPPVHGVRDNGAYILNDANETLAEVLKAEGYATAAQVAAIVLNREINLTQGFDTYADYYDTTETKEESEARHGKYRRGKEICDHAIEDLRRNQGEPFFHFVHFFDPHSPYEPPEPFFNQYKEHYIGEIAYVDLQIGRLLDALDELGLRDNTLVVLTGDHGESRWQHGEETHAAFVYDSTMAIPLIMRNPGTIPAGKRISSLVRVVDVPPTILDYVGIDGLDDAQGVSLRPLITGAETDLNLQAYNESFYARNGLGFARLRAFRIGDWKYIHAPTPELYHVSEDPTELKNLAKDYPDRVERMREDLRIFLAESPQIGSGEGGRASLSSEALAELQSLGYVGSVAPENEDFDEMEIFEPEGPDPKDHIELITLVSQTLGSVQANRDDAEAMLLKCLDRAPNSDDGFSWALTALASICVEEERFEEAVEWYTRALKVDPNDGRTLTALGETLGRMGNIEHAKVNLTAALKLKPVYAHSHVALGRVLMRNNEREAAKEQFRLALEIEPNLAPAHRCLGWMLIAEHKVDEAIAEYRAAIEQSDDVPMWRQEFADLLLATNNPEGALEQYEAWSKLEPEAVLSYAGMGDSFRAMRKNEEAMASYRRAYDLDPTLVSVCVGYGRLLLESGKQAEAAIVLRKGLEQEPTNPNLANNLAWLLATTPDGALRNGKEAIKWAEVACAQTMRHNPNYLDTLGAAYAADGQFDKAIEIVEEAILKATEQNSQSVVDEAKQHLESYRNGKPLRFP